MAPIHKATGLWRTMDERVCLVLTAWDGDFSSGVKIVDCSDVHSDIDTKIEIFVERYWLDL